MTGFRCIGIGASLGGLEALKQLFEAIAGTLSVPVCLVQHRRDDAEGRLAELLQRWTAMRVLEPDDGTPLEPGSLYLAPCDYHLLIDHERLRLSIDAPVCHARPSIDVLLESLAATFGPRAIAVVLTGANHDGAHGALSVSRAGGLVLVQEPDEAPASKMPRAALAQVASARKLPIAGIAALLRSVCEDAPSREVPHG